MTCDVKVSVIMPVYNSAAFINEAIQSVLAQKGVLFELLIGDDASTDDTWARIRAYRSHPRVRVFRRRRNMGVSVMSNRLISQAKGEYIVSCDADDRMLPGNLYKLARLLDKNPEYGVAYGDLLVMTRSGKCLTKHRHVPEKAWDLLGGCFAKGGALIRRSLIKKVGGYRTQIPFLEDCDLFLRLAEQTKFYYLPGKTLYCHRKLPGSLSDQSPKRMLKVSKEILRDTIQRRYGYQVKW